MQFRSILPPLVAAATGVACSLYVRFFLILSRPNIDPDLFCQAFQPYIEAAQHDKEKEFGLPPQLCLSYPS
jgi:hypothetical protein